MYIEDQKTELKVELTKDVKKEIIAFANTNDGTIYIGIDDNGNIIGLKNANKDLESLSGMIREGIKSDLNIWQLMKIATVISCTANYNNVYDNTSRIDFNKVYFDCNYSHLSI